LNNEELKTKQIVVISTKGGAGKTTVSSALAIHFHNKGYKIIALDADVDAPNLGIVLNCDGKEKKVLRASEKAVIDYDTCDLCGLCVENCPENALSIENDELFLNYYLCEGCGICEYVCPVDAISVDETDSGELIVGESKYGFKCLTGRLNIGEGSSGKVVAEARNTAKSILKEEKIDLVIIDGPPGSSCSTMASVTGTDFAVLVTEPTPAALSDLERAIFIVQHFKIPYGVVINKYNLIPEFEEQVLKLLNKKQGIILGQLPYDENVPVAIANLQPINIYAPNSETSKQIEKIGKKISQILFNSVDKNSFSSER